jgi:hypothetical protein
MSARASGKSLEKYYLHSQGKVLRLLLVDCFCDPDSELLQSFGALVGIGPGGVFLEYADEWQLSGYHWTGLPWIALAWLHRKELRHLVARPHIVQDRRRTESLTSSMLLWIACQEFRYAGAEALDSLGPKVHAHPHHK